MTIENEGNKKDADTLYDKKFYEKQVDDSLRSADVVLGELFQFIQPESVADVGCGRGPWLAASEKHGAKRLKGFDGPWVDKSDLQSQSIDFSEINFENTLDLEGDYDLCISVEVAEHIQESNADNFVKCLCRLSRRVLFSAAIQGQGGTFHINEQPQSYWIERFEREGFVAIDCLRSRVWENDEVCWWYRQNIFLFVPKEDLGNADIAPILEASTKTIPNLVHPELLKKYIREKEALQKKIDQPGIRYCANGVLKGIRRRLGV